MVLRIIGGGVLGIILTLSALVSLAFAEPIEQIARVITDRGGLLVGYARALDGDTIRVAGVSVRLKGVRRARAERGIRVRVRCPGCRDGQRSIRRMSPDRRAVAPASGGVLLGGR